MSAAATVSGQPLALRLALLLAAAVVAVLLVAGLLVNRAVSRSFEETLSAGQQHRLALAVTVLEDALQRGGPLAERSVERLLRQIAAEAGGTAALLDADGSVIAHAGRVPRGRSVDRLREPLSAEAGGGVLEIQAVGGGQPFLASFNAALVIAGVLSVAALVVVAALAANRLTRPLRGVAIAAHRLGDGDLGARAAGGADRESRELAAAFNGMADRLQRSEMLRRRAASDMAHDLATPATVLESQLQAMLDGVVPADRDQLEKARAEASALSGVIVQLGELASAEAAPLQRRPERVDLRDLARDATAALDSLFRDRGVRPELATGAEPVFVNVDIGQLARALRNVVTNAIQHSPAGGMVAVEVVADRAGAAVRVSDQGSGIAADDLPHVFERFYRADPARSPERHGSGIGLTIARELLAANGGEVEVERTGPEGTTFRVSLPSA